MSRAIVITVDHEIFGNGSGDVRQHVTEPTERLCRIAEKYGVPVTIFFELEEFLAFERFAPELRTHLGYDPAEEMRLQAADLVRRGHDVQLHLHPQWYGCTRSGSEWQLNGDKLTVDTLFETQEETNEYIRSRREALQTISGRPVNCYRAGGFAAQPGHKLLQALAVNGFAIESSVVKGLHRPRPHPLDYRAAPPTRTSWEISRDVAVETRDTGLWEIPVHSEMGRRYQQLTFDRLKAKFSRNVPKAQQREMMDQLGVKATPGGVLSFLWQPVPIKLDYHNLSPSQLHRMIRRAPSPPDGDQDVLVSIGHSKEHVNDKAFEDFLKRITHDPQIRAISFSDLAEKLRRTTAAAAGAHDSGE